MEEKIFIIIRINEDDYGCEERSENYIPMVQVRIRALEANDFGEYEEETIMMEDALMYARNLDEEDEVIIGYDGTLFSPEMFHNIMDEEIEDSDSVSNQTEWLNNYMDAVAELDG